MTRRKSERTSRKNERDVSNIVELAVPPNGFGAKLDLIHLSHSDRGLQPRAGEVSAPANTTSFDGASRIARRPKR